MSDTTSAAPSDAEFEAFRDAFDWDGWTCPKAAQRAFARAVLARWGAPQPPNPQAVNLADRPFIVRLAEDFADDCVNAGYVTTNAASYGRLIAEAVATHAQPVAREPLTSAQLGEDPIFRAGARFAEQYHGIGIKKGDSHG